MKQILTNIKGKLGSNTIIIGNFNIPLTSMARSSKLKINKETLALDDTLDQIKLVDLYRIFYPKTAEYTLFSSAHGTFSRTDHRLDHKTSFNKYKKIEIISSILSNHIVIKLEINYKKKTGKNTNTQRLSKMFLNN